MLSSHYHLHKSKTLSQLTQCPFTGTLLLFDPGTSTSGLSSGVTVGGTGSSLDETTGEGAVLREAVNKSATRPVEGPGTDVKQKNVTQPVEAPGAGTATQPVETPGAGPDVLPTSTGSAALHAEFPGSDSEEEPQSEPGSPVDGNVRDGSPDVTRDESTDQELSEESTYRDTIRGVRSFMGWHQIPEFSIVSLLPVPEPSLPGKSLSSYQGTTGYVERWRS